MPHNRRSPLHGVPFAVKDNVDVAGLPTTAACPAFAYTPRQTAPAVQALLDAGGWPHHTPARQALPGVESNACSLGSACWQAEPMCCCRSSAQQACSRSKCCSRKQHSPSCLCPD